MSPIAELASLFLRLGATAFGGPAAHTAMMHDEIVTRRQWLSREEFLDLISAANLIPGPNSTELAIHIGHRRAGFPGLLTAGACFILPAALIVTACAWAYTTYGRLPQAAGLLYGVKPVIIAIVLGVVFGVVKVGVKTCAGGTPGVGKNKEKGLKLEFTEKFKDRLVDEGFNPTYGARPLRRAIQRYVEDPLSEELIRGHLRGGDIDVYLDAGQLSYRPAGELAAGRKLA